MNKRGRLVDVGQPVACESIDVSKHRAEPDVERMGCEECCYRDVEILEPGRAA